MKMKSNQGRKKNAVKSASIAELTMEKKYEAVRYGERFDRAALQAVRALHKALTTKTTPPNPTVDKIIFNENRETFWQYIASNYQAAWWKHDGNFFRKLADAMEYQMKANNPAWACVSSEIISCKERGLLIPSVTEMYRDVSARGIIATRKTVENIYKFHGIERTDKRGPKPGTKRKSLHRAHR